MDQHVLADGCDLDPLAAAFEQLHPQFGFELAQRVAYRRLRQANLLARFGQAAAVDDGDQYFQLIQIH